MKQLWWIIFSNTSTPDYCRVPRRTGYHTLLPQLISWVVLLGTSYPCRKIQAWMHSPATLQTIKSALIAFSGRVDLFIKYYVVLIPVPRKIGHGGCRKFLSVFGLPLLQNKRNCNYKITRLLDKRPHLQWENSGLGKSSDKCQICPFFKKKKKHDLVTQILSRKQIKPNLCHSRSIYLALWNLA